MDREALRDRLQGELAEIRRLLDSGDVDAARDRMAGAPVNFTPLGDFARQVGDLYWDLGYPTLAGRYWYREAEKTPEMLAACAEFERSCGDNPMLIAEALGRDAPPELVRGKLGALDEQRVCLESRFRHLGLPRVKRSPLFVLLAFALAVILFALSLAGAFALLRRFGVVY